MVTVHTERLLWGSRTRYYVGTCVVTVRLYRTVCIIANTLIYIIEGMYVCINMVTVKLYLS
jgi:hypothetical protein